MLKSLEIGTDRLAYFDLGDSEDVVFLINGYTRSHSDFKAMAKHFVESGLRVIAVDNRGAGESIVSKSFLMEDMVDDVKGIMEAEGVTKSAVVGISMGGLIAQLFAATYPERVSHLVLVSTTSDPATISSSNHRWPTDLEGIVTRMNAYFSESFVAKNKLLIQAMAKNILKGMNDGDFLAQSRYQDEAIAQASLAGVHQKITCPTLLIHGTVDKIIPFGESEKLSQLLPHAERIIYDGYGHLLIAEKSKEFYEDIVKFILST